MTRPHLVIAGQHLSVASMELKVSNPTILSPSDELPIGTFRATGTMEVEYLDRAALRRWDLEMHMRWAKVGEDIIQRVLRLNPDPDEGAMVRGYAYKSRFEPRRWEGWMTRGEVIRRYGRDFWSNLPRSSIRKVGRRKYVRYSQVEQSLHFRERAQ